MIERIVITFCAAAGMGIFFAAIMGQVLDGYFEDGFHALKECARSLR